MAEYPRLPAYRLTKNFSAEELYREIRQYADALAFELDIRDTQVNNKPATKVLTVVTVASIGRPSNGDVVFAASAGKFRGFVSGTGWVDFN